jgi:hypothetical protein
MYSIVDIVITLTLGRKIVSNLSEQGNDRAPLELKAKVNLGNPTIWCERLALDFLKGDNIPGAVG